MKMKILINGINSYDFVDKSNVRQQGMNVEYLLSKTEKDNLLGFFSAKQKIDYSSLNKVVDIPGYYEGDFVMETDTKDRKSNLILKDIKFIKKVEYEL